MSTTDTGKKAEAAAADYLQKQGYTIREHNWRTRWCEIDVIAEKDDTIFFVEVKYRKTSAYGDGLEYITPKKLQQMAFAAEFWVASHHWKGSYELAAAAVSGDDFQVTDIIPV